MQLYQAIGAALSEMRAVPRHRTGALPRPSRRWLIAADAQRAHELISIECDAHASGASRAVNEGVERRVINLGCIR